MANGSIPRGQRGLGRDFLPSDNLRVRALQQAMQKGLLDQRMRTLTASDRAASQSAQEQMRRQMSMMQIPQPEQTRPVVGMGGIGGRVPQTQPTRPVVGMGGIGGRVPPPEPTRPVVGMGGIGGQIPPPEQTRPVVGMGGIGGEVPPTQPTRPVVGMGGIGGQIPPTQPTRPVVGMGGIGGRVPATQPSLPDWKQKILDAIDAPYGGPQPGHHDQFTTHSPTTPPNTQVDAGATQQPTRPVVGMGG